MQKGHFRRIIIISSFLLFFFGSIISTATNLTVDSNDLYTTISSMDKYTTNIMRNDVKDSNEEHLPINAASKLKIEDITGGIGLTFFVKNEGDRDIKDIQLKIDTDGLYLKKISRSPTNIPLLPAGESKEISIKVFGFCIGELEKYDRFLIKINATNISTMIRVVLVNVVGPIVDVKAIFVNDEGSFNGYTLYSPDYSMDTYLINKNGKTVHSWKSDYILGLGFNLLENGNLVRTCLTDINPTFPLNGATGRIEIFDWNNTLLWEFELSTGQKCLNHEIDVLPNGNILMIGWELKTAEEAVEAGRNPLLVPAGVLWSSFIIEVKPIFPKGSMIVWEWHVWDHLVQDHDSSKNNYGIVKDHPELIDINFGVPTGVVDWNHLNSLDYNEEFDQILISSHVQNEIWVIDHSTTKEEAAGHNGGKYGKGGDLLYRWGNPQTYRAGNEDDQRFFGQHDARWIEPGCPGEGNILVFNNGLTRLESFYSSVDEIVPPVDINGSYYLEKGTAFGPKGPVWRYTAENPTDFFAPITSGSQRLPNGNTLICDGPQGVFFEVTPEKEIVWRYNNLYPILTTPKSAAKVELYPPEYPGIKEFNTNDFDRSALINNYPFLNLIYKILRNFNIF